MGTFGFSNFLQTLYDGYMRDGMFMLIYEMVKDEKSVDHKKSLLLQACLFYDRSKVTIDQHLIKAVFAEFKFMEQELGQCLGFLFLLYENNSAAFSQLSLSQVIDLENDVPTLPLQLCTFLKQFLAPYAKPFFPATLLCLTPPIITEIQERAGKALFYDVPSEFLIDHMDILVYSFERNIDQFHSYVQQMQHYYISYHFKLRHFHFQRAMSFMSSLLKRKDQRWICNLKRVADFFKTLINDVILKKETYITDEILTAVSSKDGEYVENIPNQKMNIQAHIPTDTFWEEAKYLNRNNAQFLEFLEAFELDQFDKAVEQLIHYLRIDKLHPTQQLCLSYILERQRSTFSVVGIGHGKTILCNILAAYFATTTDKQVIVLNKQKNLSIRNAILFDETLSKKLNLVVGFDAHKLNEKSQVVFMCDDELKTYLLQSGKQLNELILIIDEADQVLMTELSTKVKEQDLLAWKEKLLYYSQASAIYAFTGTITDIEMQCVKEAFNADIICYPHLNKVKQQLNTQLRNEEFNDKERWMNALVSEIQEKHMNVPILVLLASRYEKELMLRMKRAMDDEVMIMTLNNKDAIAINVALQEMNTTDEKRGYPVVLIDEALCRGLDVRTSAEIEKNGGIYVIIAKVPASHKTMNQALGRTQRLIYKGQHSILVYNNTKRSLDQQLRDADAKIDFNIRQLLQLLKSENKHIQKQSLKKSEEEKLAVSDSEQNQIEEMKLKNVPKEHDENIWKNANAAVGSSKSSMKMRDNQLKLKQETNALKVNSESEQDEAKEDYKILFGADEMLKSNETIISVNTNKKDGKKSEASTVKGFNVGKKRTQHEAQFKSFTADPSESQSLTKNSATTKRRRMNADTVDQQAQGHSASQSQLLFQEQSEDLILDSKVQNVRNERVTRSSQKKMKMNEVKKSVALTSE